VHRQGLSIAGYGLLLALNSGLVLALQLPATRLTSRWRPEHVIAVTSVIIGAGFGLLALAHTAALLAVAVTVWSLGELAQWPVAAAYTTSLAPPGMTGRYAGARSLCYGSALLLAPLASTALYHLSPALLWGCCAAAGICAAAAITPAPAGLQLQARPFRHSWRPGSRKRPRQAWPAQAPPPQAGRGTADGPAIPERGILPHPSGTLARRKS
jgi:MFS family permease